MTPGRHCLIAARISDIEWDTPHAAELPRVALDDALEVCLLMARQHHASFGRAATRWLARFALEAPTVGLEDIEEAVSALMAMPEEPERSARRLADLAAAHGLRL